MVHLRLTVWFTGEAGKRGIMARRVTMQDIADALGISRNTVSKAINNTGILADSTREKVLKKAVEMGYKQFSYINVSGMTESGEVRQQTEMTAGKIALLTRGLIANSSFVSDMLDRFQEALSRLGYGFTMYRVREEDEENLRLPAFFEKEEISGLICVEVLEHKYCNMLCELNLPVLFVDSPAVGLRGAIRADCIYPDNQAAVCEIVREMVRRGKRRIGFVGEYMHCQSFFERYMGYRNAMYLSGLPCGEEYCAIGNRKDVSRPGPEEYQEYLAERFSQMKEMPEALLCANDYVAFDTMRVLKKMGISVPEDIWLCGFDDTVEARVITPALTSVRIHSDIMGESAAYLLASRIREPSLHFRTVHVQTSPMYRESTEIDRIL